MIKSVTYLGEGKRSYEVTDESDIEALETGLAEGSSARVVGKIESEYELQGGTWKKTAGGGSALPSVTSADNGKVLGVVDGAWAADDKRFVVTCTPTAQDYSGMMNAAGLYEAYKAGKNIFFAVEDGFVPRAAVIEPDGNHVAFSFYLFLVEQDVLVVGETIAISSSHTGSVPYSTSVYQLTPLGS